MTTRPRLITLSPHEWDRLCIHGDTIDDCRELIEEVHAQARARDQAEASAASMAGQLDALQRALHDSRNSVMRLQDSVASLRADRDDL
jgi:hypothetical protein